MGDALLDLTAEEIDLFLVGAHAYERPIPISRGLGPIMNSGSCVACHSSPTGGGGDGSTIVIRVGFLDGDVFDPLEEFGGSIIQIHSITDECLEDIPAEANVLAIRITNGMLGYGLVEAILDEDLLALEDPDDLDGDGISGRAHMVEPLEDPGVFRVGRFGWKAQTATILSFSAEASRDEMGFTNRFLPEENDPNGIRPPNLGDPDFCDIVDDPEDSPLFGDGVSRDFIDVITDFQRFLAPPPQTPRSGMIGEAIFEQIGCADCHISTAFTTPDDEALEGALRNKTIRPYSDFLLHDMGDSADFIAQGDASIKEIRTPPLWGLRARPRLWHDGRADGDTTFGNIEQAIIEHGAAGSEAVASAVAFSELTEDDHDSLLRFLNSLGRIEFDHDNNNLLDDVDFLHFLECSQIEDVILPDDPCAVHDVDQDGDIDVDDLNVMVTVYEAEHGDCNENGIDDLIDIVQGTSADVDGNTIPDECELLLEEVPLLSFSIRDGVLVAGDLLSLEESDDDWLQISSIEQNQHLAGVFFAWATNVNQIFRLDFKVEASSLPGGANMPIEIRNWASGGWDPLGELALGDVDAVLSVADIPDPERYVRTNGRIMTRLLPRGALEDFPDGFILAVDEIEMLIAGAIGDAATFNGECRSRYDLDVNGDIDADDLIALFQQWHRTVEGAPDFNGDQIVDASDLLMMFAHWTDCSR